MINYVLVMYRKINKYNIYDIPRTPLSQHNFHFLFLDGIILLNCYADFVFI